MKEKPISTGPLHYQNIHYKLLPAHDAVTVSRYIVYINALALSTFRKK